LKKTISEVLLQRAETHGDFGSVSQTAQALKTIIHKADHLKSAHVEALDLIATKIARICHGNSEEPEHWLDIQGYAALAALAEVEREKK
tara:strand:+ start:20 stop:286 length:267 start_codon:yes stop_codon:yes gene_type:complete